MTANHWILTVEVRPGKFRATCTCGKYRSRAYDFPGYAQRAGAAHCKAKG